EGRQGAGVVHKRIGIGVQVAVVGVAYGHGRPHALAVVGVRQLTRQGRRATEESVRLLVAPQVR
ncbi:hypothetical protein CEN46_12095, partial [Fischerella thermalis CCMEE 5318]